MRSSRPISSLISSFAAAAMAIAPLSVAFAAPVAKEPAADDAAEEPAADDAAEEPAADDAGEEPAADDAGEEPADDAGEEPADDAGEEPAADDAGEEPADDAGEEPAADDAEDAGEEPAADDAGEGDVTSPSYLPEEDDRPPEPRIANKPATGKGLMIAGGTLAGVGLGLTITFALITRKCSFDGPLQCRLKNQDDFLIPMGAAALLAGTMVLAVGVGYHFKYKRWQRWSPEDDKKVALIPVPTAMRGGGGLAWSGRF